MAGTCSEKSASCRDVFGDDGLLSGHADDVGFVSGRVRRSRIVSGRDRRVRFSVDTCSARSALCRDVFCEVGLVSESVRRSFLSVVKCSARSA